MSGRNIAPWLPRVFLDTPFRLSAVYVALFCGVVAVTFIYVYLSLQGFLTDHVQASVESEMASLTARYEQAGLPGLQGAVATQSSSSKDFLYLLADQNQVSLGGNLEVISTTLWNNIGGATFTYRRTGSDGAVKRQAFGIVTRFASGHRLLIAQDTEGQESIKRLMREAFLWGYGVIALLGLLGGVVMSGRLLARVEEASSTAHAIMQGNLSRRIPVTGRDDEFDRLSRNLNAMLDRIQDLMTGLKDVSDNIAHDLKTPLHRLRTRAERALHENQSPERLKSALTSVIEDADTLIQTFDALLNIARLEAGARDATYGPLNICNLIRDVTELYEPVADEQGLKLVMGCAGDVIISGERHLLGQALANLIDNAIKYVANEGPSLRKAVHHDANAIEVGFEDNGESVDVIVADHGPGIPAADRERVLQRFVRLQPSRSTHGSGLGLSLVAAVARLHGGQVILEDNAPGLRARLRLLKTLPVLNADRH